MFTPNVIAHKKVMWLCRGLMHKAIMVTVQGDGLMKGCQKLLVVKNKLSTGYYVNEYFGGGMENYEFNFNYKNEVKNHDEAKVLRCGKTKLCRILHRFDMFTQIT